MVTITETLLTSHEIATIEYNGLIAQREQERIAEYKWVDSQVSKAERQKLLPNSDTTALNSRIATLRQYANNVWATQQQADYPLTVTYPIKEI